MSFQFAVGDLTIHRIIEQETTFLPALEMLPGLTQLSQLEGKGEQNQYGSIESLHYKTGTWERADL
jgi:hypothetical protein